MRRYRSDSIQQLSSQLVRFSPQAVRNRQVLQAEDILLKLNADQAYDYSEICEHVTGYRPDKSTDEQIAGVDLVHDLRVLIEDLSDSLGLSLENCDEPMLTVEEVSDRFNVSAKTVGRWRDRGLPSRRMSLKGRKRVVISESALNRFAEKNKAEISRGSSFRQMTRDEREQIVLEGRTLAAEGLNLTEVSRRLSEKLGRAIETIRYTLRDFDRLHPQNAIFPKASTPVSTEQQALIFDLRRQGVSVDDLARRFRRTKSAVNRILADVRIKRLKATPIEFMDNDEFRTRGAEKRICCEAPPYDEGTKAARVPSGLPAYLGELYRVPLLNKAQEQHYFRKMNYLKYRASLLQEKLSGRGNRSVIAKQLEERLADAEQIKNLLTRSNLRLVVSIAKKHLKPGVNFFELVSDGNMSLIRAIEKFDYFRGNKFSTYASWAIMKNYARSIPTEHKRNDRFRTGHDELFYDSKESRSNPFSEELTNKAQRDAIMEILGELNGREQKVIACRFGLDAGSEPETLEQVGQRLGVTKERVRQIEVRSLEKLRRIAERKRVDIPGI